MDARATWAFPIELLVTACFASVIELPIFVFIVLHLLFATRDVSLAQACGSDFVVCYCKKRSYYAFGCVVSFCYRLLQFASYNDRFTSAAKMNNFPCYAPAFTYASLLRICGNLKSLSDGRRVHQHIITFQQERDNFLGSLLVQMYAKCGILEDSRDAFVNLHERNRFSCNCLIGAYARHRQGKQSINLFEQMQAEAVISDRVTFVNMLSASAGEVALNVGRQLHARLISNIYFNFFAV